MAATDPVLSRLTDQQTVAAATPLPRVYIEAHPGSGKTTVAAQRFGALRYARTPPPHDRGVVAVSFTRAATAELRHRVEVSWGPTALSGPHQIVTLDTLVYDLFRDLLIGGIVHWPEGHTDLEIIDTWTMRLERFWTVLEVRVVLDGSRVSTHRQRTARGAHLRLEEVAAQLQAGVCTHEDVRHLLEEALDLPGARDRVRRRLAQTTSALIVDEIFDANSLDLTIVEVATEAGIPTTLIGDPWQALYGFRGAQPDLVPDVIARIAATTLPLTQSFRWETEEQAALASQVRSSQPSNLPMAATVETDVVLSRQWEPLWNVDDALLPLAFKPKNGNTPYATATLLLNALTTARFGVSATYLNEALITLGITDPQSLSRLEAPLGDIIALLASDAADAAKTLWPELVSIVKTEAPRSIPENAHHNYYARLRRIAVRAQQPTLTPGMTVHQAKGREWPVVGVHLIEKDAEHLAAGLTNQTEIERQLYVAVTRARRRTVQV
ncbi:MULTISPECIES: UvrD-helicase domain-containing protein [unclassified Isoptericola]|uniref:UvrD-helicase domain-containing protein n=1 Tax=unclassified Isoptericola TaxID=2623355 RepID=UPI00366163B0